MVPPALDHTYRYPFASRFDDRGRHLSLATSGGEKAHPEFFVGLLRQPHHAADMMLTLGLVARSRFALPPAMLARIIAAADPVVTSDGQRLRMESFSACCGVYARADLLPGAVDGQWQGRGTTNVDFNQPLRAALTRLGQADELRLSVGAEQLEVQTPDAAVVERKVPLPMRWLKGFVAVQAFSADMALRHEVSAAEARRFLRALPRQRSRGDFWVVSAGRVLRPSKRRGRDGVQVGGLERLSVLDALARHARALRIYARDDGQASAWELSLGAGSEETARFSLLLSADVWRGLSGEGVALPALAAAEQGHVPAVRASLKWQATLDSGALGRQLDLEPDAVEAALATLGARGLVGYDLAAQRYFHRELPFDLDLVRAPARAGRAGAGRSTPGVAGALRRLAAAAPGGLDHSFLAHGARAGAAGVDPAPRGTGRYPRLHQRGVQRPGSQCLVQRAGPVGAGRLPAGRCRAAGVRAVAALRGGGHTRAPARLVVAGDPAGAGCAGARVTAAPAGDQPGRPGPGLCPAQGRLVLRLSREDGPHP